VEEKREKENKKMDVMGSLSLMGMLLTLLLSFQLLSESGMDIKFFVMLIAFILSILLFIYVEKKAEELVISLDLFSNQMFVVVNLVAALMSGFLMAVEVYIPMWMQGVLGSPAGLGGLVLAPLSILWVVGSMFAGR